MDSVLHIDVHVPSTSTVEVKEYSLSQYSHMKSVAHLNLEVLKNVSVAKQLNKRGRPSEKRACL
jgi:hypothetical protein